MRWILAVLVSFQLSGAQEVSALKTVLDDQTRAWNRGDIDEFMKGYDNSKDITFVGKSLSRGYDAVLARYRRDYGDKAKMGTLRFEEVEVKILSANIALVLGRYVLERSPEGGGPASGRFTLVAKKTHGGWKFIHDHTSN